MVSAGRPIFIVGCPRSGTTLLSAMLHAHPDIAMPPETRFLLPIYERRVRFGDLTVAANRRRLAGQITHPRTRFDDLRLDRAAVRRAIMAAPPTLGSAMACVWQAFAADRGKPRWGEKRPAYWRELGVVLRLFPTAQIVHLVRDPRSCVASLARVPWWRSGTPGAAALWVSAERALAATARTLPADRYHRIRYEDLTSEPAATLDELCAFLDEPFDERMLDHTAAAADIVPARKTWHRRVRGSVDPGRAQAWHDELSPQDIALVERVAHRRMARHGYPASGSGAHAEPAELAECAARIARTQAWIRRRRIRDAWIRHRHPMPLAARD